MTSTCAHCGAELGDAEYCPQCGQAVLSPQSRQRPPEGDDWRSDTAERPAIRAPIEPAPAASTPGPPRFPLYADETTDDVSGHADTPVRPQPPTFTLPPQEPDDDDRRAAPPWLPWAIVALVMLLVAVGGAWLLLSPGGDDDASEPASAPSASAPQDSGDEPSTASSAAEETESAPPSESAPPGEPVDVAGQAVATTPRNAPPNVDVAGNRTTYVAANMLDGRPDTCWRMAGDGTGSTITFALAAPTTLTRVGMINGYAKTSLSGGRKLDWYVGHRRVLSAQWVFDDGTTVSQPLGSTKAMQTIDIGTPVTTSSVTLRLVSVSAPGTGRSARNYTAISEVSLVGTPSA